MSAASRQDTAGVKAFRRLALALVAAALAFGAPAAGRAADAPLAVINLINLPSDNAAEVYYALELGYFKDAGLDVRITPMTNSGAVIAAIAGGGGDIGNSVVGSVADARGKGIPVLFIAPAGLADASSPTAALVTAKDSPIKQAADVTSHRVDAAYIVEPFYAVNESTLHLLARASEAVSMKYMATGWIASESWLQTHADLALRFGTAIHRTALWANAHHKESAAILLKYIKIDPAIAERMNRVPYAVALEPRLLQPAIDAAAKYTGQAPISANSLIWAPAK